MLDDSFMIPSCPCILIYAYDLLVLSVVRIPAVPFVGSR